MYVSYNLVMQPATFWKRDLFFQPAVMIKPLRFSFNYDLFLKFSRVTGPGDSKRSLRRSGFMRAAKP